ncbi:caspase domain-containing protein [Mycena vulgaris]|nr:caspase domain-containing protein [Mycena vulgaris]
MTNSSGGPGAIFALIIGINEYKAKDEFGTLRGAVTDAKSFEEFLKDPRESGGLQVPPSCIKFLADENATHSAILSAFDSHFLDNPNIPDDGTAAIIFFFAGHGSRVVSPGNLLPTDGKVEVICPVDDRTLGDDGEPVTGIPDYALAHRLQQLAIKKGNNITVILDSCHSGGMARDDVVDGRARSPSKPSHLEPPEVYDPFDPSKPHSVWTPSSASHVLLAACSQGGKAYETAADPFHGQFTGHLITALRSAVFKETTYASLIEDLPKLPAESQIPHCGGAYTDRLIFTRNRPVPGMRTLPLKELQMIQAEVESDVLVREGMEFDVYEGRKRIFTLVVRMVMKNYVVLASQNGTPIQIHQGSHAVIDKDRTNTVSLTEQSSSQAFLIRTGSFEGVREGMQFPIRTPTGDTLDSLTAKIVGIGHTILISQSDGPIGIPKGSRAVVKEWEEKVGIYVPPDFGLELFLPGPGNARRLEQVTSPEVADIALRRDADNIVVERITGIKIGYPSETRFALKNPLQLPSALAGIAHFHHFFDRHNQRTLLSDFSLEMHPLEGHFPTRRPIGDNVITPYGERVYKAEIMSDRRAKYGFTIRNTTNQDLFPYLFYFDPLTYKITPWYTPERSSVRPPLHKITGKVIVGMGGDGAFSFFLAPGESSSSAFIKLFVSTEYLDLGWIEQQVSPFSDTFVGTGRSVIRESFRSPDWDALQVVLTMSEEGAKE